jgi:hypothetical protein
VESRFEVLRATGLGARDLGRDDEAAQGLIRAILSAARWAIESPTVIKHFESTTLGWKQARENAERLHAFLNTILFVADPKQKQLIDLLTWLLDHIEM